MTRPGSTDANEAARRLIAPLATAGKLAIVLAAVGWALDVPSRLGVLLLAEQFMALCLGLALAVILLEAARRGAALPLIALAAAAFCASLYVAIDYQSLSFAVSFRPPDAVAAGAVLILAIVVAVALTSGRGLLAVVLAFLLYGLVGRWIPGELGTRPIPVDRLLVYLGLDGNGVLGLPLRVACIVVIPFILFGQLLSRFGGGDFFTDLAAAFMGRSRGGAAKIAIFASALFGTISGSAVGNVVGSGVVTIPLMKRSGLSGERAGAIEAVASTGGQLMPPVMGASAFLMAEFLQISYAEVMLAALLPAALYFFSLFVQVDLLAARDGVRPLERADIPPLGATLRSGWHFLAPFGMLVYGLFGLNWRPEIAALAACAALIAGGFIFGYRGARPGLADIVRAGVGAGAGVKEIIAITAAAGIVIGVLNLTGLAFNLTVHLVAASGDSLIALLALTAVVSIVLGMGMPTVGVYVLLATLVAPSLTRAGVPELTAHMFVLYFGMLSMVTPPVGLAAFAGANLAGADPMRTSWTAAALGWSAYVVPFLFVATPALLFSGAPLDVLWAMVAAVAGIWAASTAIIGVCGGPLPTLWRAAFLASGMMLFAPAALSTAAPALNVAGLAVGLSLIAVRTTRRRPVKLQ